MALMPMIRPQIQSGFPKISSALFERGTQALCSANQIQGLWMDGLAFHKLQPENQRRWEGCSVLQQEAPR